MADMGKFVRNNVSADLMYSIDLESGICHITHLDDRGEGYEFLNSLSLSNEIALNKSNGDILRMKVKALNVRYRHIDCEALLV